MASVKTRRLISTVLIFLLGSGALAFFALELFPLMREVHALYREVKSAEGILARHGRAAPFPSNGLVSEYAELKSSMEQEARRCAEFYLSRSKALDVRILRSWSDPNEVAEEYFKLKEELGALANNPDFVEMEWEKDGVPPKDRLGDVEKQACVIKVVVHVLTARRTQLSTVIESMKLGEPRGLREAPKVPDVDWKVARCRVFPVEVVFTTSFRDLGGILNLIVSSRRTSPDPPPWAFMAIKSLEVESLGPQKRGRVKIRLTLDVYDFYEV